MRKIITAFIVIIIFLTNATLVFARSGCCSRHGGVRADGCGCNDGTSLSSTCAPYYTCSSGESSNYVPVQQTQQVVYPISTLIPIESTNTPFPTKPPISTITPTPTLTIKPTQVSSPTATVKPTEKPVIVAIPTPAPKESFWRQLVKLLFHF